MVALTDVDFVVVQFANGVDIEDCQEVELKGSGEISVRIPRGTIRTSKL